MTTLPATYLTMLTLVKPEGQLELSLARRPLVPPKDREVVVKVQATPINPSDLGLMVGGADITTARGSQRDGLPVITASVPPAGMRAMAARIGEALPIGNEGAGLVVEAGASPEAQALMGKTVAMIGGSLYAEYRTLPAPNVHGAACRHRPSGRRLVFRQPADGARRYRDNELQGYKGIVHTAAASNLGQMLVKICAKRRHSAR